MDGGDEDKAQEAWETKTTQQTKNKLDGEDRKESPKRRKLSNEELLDSEEKMDGKGGEGGSAQTLGDQAFIIQLQEEVQTKDLTIQALQFENQKLKQQQAAPQNVSPVEKKVLDQYKMKIMEYQAALSQRDQVIGTLQTRLAELVQQRDEALTDAAQQTENFGREVETLKLQLQEATDALTKKWVTGVNPREHLVLKNKLIAVQQSFDQDRQFLEEVTKQLTEKAERCNLLELKYKQCLHKCKQVQVENEDLKSKNKSSEANLMVLEEEKKKLEEKLNEAKERFASLTEEGKQTVLDIQNLMGKMQELTVQLKVAKEEKDRQIAAAEERLGSEITLIKQKMSEQHSEEILKIKEAYEKELEEARQQISALEKLHLEDHARLVAGVEAERNKVHILESTLSDIMKKNEEKENELEQQKEKRVEVEEQLKVEIERVRDLREKNELLEKELEDKEKEVAENKSFKNDMNVQLQNMNMQYDGVMKKIEEYQVENKNLKLKYDELLVEKENWNQEKASLTAELQYVEKLNAEVNNLEGEVRMKVELEKELVICRNVQVDLQRKCSELQSYEKVNLDLQGDLEKKDLELMKLKEKCDQMSAIFEELAQSKAEKEELNSQIQGFQQKYNSATEKLNELEREQKNLQSKYEGLQEEKENWLKEKETLNKEIGYIEKLNEEVNKLQEELKIKIELEKEVIGLRVTREDLQKRLAELEHCNERNVGLEADLEKKNLEIAELKGKYSSLLEEYELFEKVDWLSDEELLEERGMNLSIKSKVKELVQKLKETDKNLHSMEMTLREACLEKEALLSEMEQLRKTCDSMERHKNETEAELEKMMDQYKMMEAELVDTRLALDREVQLATHQRITSDVGASVSASLEDRAAQTSSVTSVTYPLPEDNHSEQGDTDTAIVSLGTESKGGSDGASWKEKYVSLEKSKKECENEIEKLKIKSHDQYFAIQSLENVKSKLSRRIEELEMEKKKWREDQRQLQELQAEKMQHQVLIKELEFMLAGTEEKLKQAEQNMNQLRMNVQNLVKLHSSENPEFSQKITNFLGLMTTKSEKVPKECIKLEYEVKIEELHIIYEDYRKCLSSLQDVLHHSDTLHKEKLVSHLENAVLKSEIQKLRTSPEIREKQGEPGEKSDFVESNVKEVPECASTENANVVLKHENERLKIALNQQQIRCRLEKLQYESPRLQSQQEQGSPRKERELFKTQLGNRFKQILQDWEDKAKCEPSLANFISAESHKVHNILQSLDELEDDSPSSHVYMETAIQFIRDAVVKTVDHQYLHVVNKMVNRIDENISESLEKIFPGDVALILDGGSHLSGSEGGEDTSPQQDGWESLVEKVERLIGARAILAEAANEFEGKLKASFTSELSSVSHELQKVVKTIASEEAAETKQTSFNTALRGVDDHFVEEFMEITKRQFEGDQVEKLQLLENQKMMIHKILEDNKAKLHNLCSTHISNLNTVASIPDAIQLVNTLVKSIEKTLSEEVSWVEQQYKELLEQYAYEQNLIKQTYFQTLKELKLRLDTLLIESNEQKAGPSDESSLGAEMVKMKEEHAAEVARLENQLAARDNEALMALDDEVDQLRAQIDHDLCIRSDISRTLCSELENIKIQVTQLEDAHVNLHKIIEPATDVNSLPFQRHLRSLYSDRDWYKKTVGLLSHVTLQLLHYYSVAENYTHKSHAAPSHDSIQYQEVMPGKVLDLSFLSDCVHDESEGNQFTTFPEDSVVSTGLIGKTVEADHGEETELGSNAESMLDSTAMSEGMLDDMDKDEQVRQILTKSYPQLMSILKGRWDRVMVDHLEKEVQELTISLQASAGMLKIFMHSVTENQDLSSHTIRDESRIDNTKECSLELTQHHMDEFDVADQLGQPGSNRQDEEGGDQQCGDQDDSLPDAERASQLAKLQPTSHFSSKYPEDFSQSLTQLLCHDDSFLNLTKLKPQDLGDEEKLKRAIVQLCRNAEATDNLQLKLHHLEGLLKGCEQEKNVLEEEIEHLNHCNKNLAIELQSAKDQLEEFELVQQGKGGAGTTQYAARMEASKDIKERVRAVLSAKNKSMMNHSELITRIGDLEGMLEALVRESDAITETLKAQVSDLSQQLEVADRQLRSSRQFLEEHASERDQEVEDLIQAKEKLQAQLRERDATIAQHANLEKEIWDLRDIIQSLESQLDAKCVQELEVNTQVESLKSTLALAQRHSLDLTQQLEEVQCARGEDSTGYGEHVSTRFSRISAPEEEENEAQHASSSLFRELTQEGGLATQNADGQTLLQVIEDRLDRTTRGLEALQLSISSASQSEEDLSVKDHLEVPSLRELEGSRALSPSTLDRRLEDKLLMLERTTEAAVKRTRDLEMTVKNLRLDLDEAIIERDALQERSSEQLVQISSLEARLDELRRSDHPMAAEMRQRFTLVQEDLEKKRNELAIRGREVEELRFNLNDLRGKLLSREDELQRLLSVSQPHSLPQSSAEQLLAKHQQQEDLLKARDELIEKLKNELAKTAKGSGMPPALSYRLIDDKNAELDNLAQRLEDVKARVKDVALQLSQNGNVEEAVNMLKRIAIDGKFHETLDNNDNTHNLEVLRREPVEVSPSLTSVIVSNSKEKSSMIAMPTSGEEDTMTTQSSQDLSLMSVQTEALKVPDKLVQEVLSASTELKQVLDEVIEGREKSFAEAPDGTVTEKETFEASMVESKADEESMDVTERKVYSSQEGIEPGHGKPSPPEQAATRGEITLTREDYESLCSASDEVTVLRVEIDLLQKEITSLNDYQKKLEEDYRIAQDLLEAREAEITQLSEEIEDVVPQPLPSETIQLQDRCFRLEDQLLELQGKLENMETDYEEERKCHQESEEKLLEYGKERDRLKETIKEGSEKLKNMEMDLRMTKRNLEEKTDQLQQIKQKYAEQAVVLRCKEEELVKINAQVDHIQVEMKEKLSHANRELTKMEQQYQREILDVKEEQIVREKQLCSDYEERMADQVSDLTKLVRDKEETISRIRQYYESELKEAVAQKDQALRKANEWRERLRVEEAGEQSRDISRLCDSLEELKAGVAQEVNKSDQLDTSLVTYLKQGQDRENAGRSNRASSTYSDVSEGDETGDVVSKIQKLMTKVHHEGVQVLTLIELMFLQKHQSHLNTTQKSLISQTCLLGIESLDNSSIASREVSPKSGPSGIDAIGNRERTQLLRRMASLEEELSKKEREMKEKVEQLEFRLEQEEIAADELKLNTEADKRRIEKLSEQLHQERLLEADQISEITFLRSQHNALQMQLQKVQEERNHLRESLDSAQKQIETLRADLQAERSNFSNVSKVLNQQRRLSSTTKNQQNQVIKDLRETLERERERILTLRAQLNEAVNKQMSVKSGTSRASARARNSDILESNIRSPGEDVKVQLVIEQERVAELQRSHDKEVMKVQNLTEQLRIERASSKALLMEEQGKCAEYTKMIRNLEAERDKLKRQIASDRERIQHQESRIRELEGDLTKLEAELRAQAAAHEMASHRVREGDAQLHASYTSALNKLGEAEAEACSLRLRNSLLSKDLELAREKELQLQQELTTEKMAINRLGLPALAKINNLNEYFELQLKENVELCKSVLRLTDNRHSARLKIVSLEATITDLTEQLIKAKAAAHSSPTPERILRNERSIWETERAALQSLISRKDAELMRLRREAESRLSNQNFSGPADDSRVQYIYGKYLRSESWRKALVYQKKYLLVVLQGYEATEQVTYSRLNVMAERVYGPASCSARVPQPRGQPNHRFRVRVLVVIACCRMRYLVQRWKRSRRLGSQILLPNPPASAIGTPEPTHGSRPDSAASGPAIALGIAEEPRVPLTLNRTLVGTAATWGGITGHTPPTKETTNSPSLQHQGTSVTRRSLFPEQESSSLDEYIERLGNIHSKLGLTPRKNN
ncbi:A-kinase anchor protein 9-like isoform X4 [Penaeus japonicus]|uniref:A-kinase anchor protein 9-like isoform X4 n=1 Tax=Penaeus japonicus TaxID=27405 RepID=UPI001C710EBC|nr:A-kinase anchor protein 9-like isoform X4 [Penaeus japonicus]